MQNVLELAFKTATASSASRIECVRLRVGQMSGVVPDALQFAFETLRQGTIAAEARLDIETVPATCWCSQCNQEFVAEDYISECPRCHSLATELRRGLELEVASMDVS